jgi:hypothetical protein
MDITDQFAISKYEDGSFSIEIMRSNGRVGKRIFGCPDLQVMLDHLISSIQKEPPREHI